MYYFICITVKSLNFVGTNFRNVTTTDMFPDTWIRGFQNILNITKVKRCFVWNLNSWIVPPTKYTKLNVKRIKKWFHTNWIRLWHMGIQQQEFTFSYIACVVIWNVNSSMYLNRVEREKAHQDVIHVCIFWP